MNKSKASTDKAYCVNSTCNNKCWRYISKWEFDAEINYCFISGYKNCEKEVK